MPLLKYLQEVFHLRKRGMEAFRVMPFVQLRILNLLGISCCWDCVFCVAEVHEDVCVRGSFSLSHTLACKSMRAQKHTLMVSSISAVKPDPPRLFSLVIMSKFAQEGRGKGRAMWTCVGVFCFFFVVFCLITADLRRPRSKSPSVAFQTPSSKTFSSLSFFNRKRNLALGRGETLYLPSNKYIKCKECREKSSLLERLQGNLVNSL